MSKRRVATKRKALRDISNVGDASLSLVGQALHKKRKCDVDYNDDDSHDSGISVAPAASNIVTSSSRTIDNDTATTTTTTTDTTCDSESDTSSVASISFASSAYSSFSSLSTSSSSSSRRCLDFSSSSTISSSSSSKRPYSTTKTSRTPFRRHLTSAGIYKQFFYSLNKISDVAATTTFESTMSSTMCHHHHYHELIKESLEKECDTSDGERLVGDKSRQHALPVMEASRRRHADLNSISADTLKSLLDGEFARDVPRYVIVDSRYPYEFDAGHIRGAHNVYTREALMQWAFPSSSSNSSSSSSSSTTTTTTSMMMPTVVVFHCEFSSERGPSLLRFLRSQDRAINMDAYPRLFYPELYLLEGGYKAFFEKHPEYCEPQGYKPMLHQDHMKDLKHFRAKAKTWESKSSKKVVTNFRLCRVKSTLF